MATPHKECEATRAELCWLRTQWDAAGRAEPPLLRLGDGGFDVVALWTTQPERTILLTRTAGNRVLHELPSVGSHSNRRCGARTPRPDAWLHERRGC
jgi:hypothetical protein